MQTSLSATEALELGVVNCVEAPEELEKKATSVATRLAETNVEVLKQIRLQLWLRIALKRP